MKEVEFVLHPNSGSKLPTIQCFVSEFQLQQERGGKVLLKAFRQICHHYERLAWDEWTKFVALSRAEDRTKGLIRVQKLYRGYRARKYVFRIKNALAIRREEHRFTVLLKGFHEQVKARDIQRVFRGSRGRAAANIIRSRVGAAMVLQRAWRVKTSKMIVMMLSAAKLRVSISRILTSFNFPDDISSSLLFLLRDVVSLEYLRPHDVTNLQLTFEHVFSSSSSHTTTYSHIPPYCVAENHGIGSYSGVVAREVGSHLRPTSLSYAFNSQTRRTAFRS